MRQLIGIEDIPWPSEEVALTRYERRVGRHIVDLRLLAAMIAPVVVAACLLLVPTLLTNYFAVLLTMWPSAFVANYAGLAVALGNGGSIEFLAVPIGGRVVMPEGRMPLRVLRSMMIFGQAFQIMFGAALLGAIAVSERLYNPLGDVALDATTPYLVRASSVLVTGIGLGSIAAGVLRSAPTYRNGRPSPGYVARQAERTLRQGLDPVDDLTWLPERARQPLLDEVNATAHGRD